MNALALLVIRTAFLVGACVVLQWILTHDMTLWWWVAFAAVVWFYGMIHSAANMTYREQSEETAKKILEEHLNEKSKLN